LGLIFTFTYLDFQNSASSIQLACLGFFCLYYYVIDISFRVVTNLFTETCLNSSLIGGTGVLESKGYGFIAIGVGVMKDGLHWSSSLNAI
jgi:hypothetical protein